MVFKHKFFSWEGQKERLKNVGDVLKAVNPFAKKSERRGVELNTPDFWGKKQVEAVLSRPFETAAGIATAINLAGPVSKLASSIGAKVAPITSRVAPGISKAVGKIVGSKAGSSVLTSSAALALTNPELITAKNIRHVAGLSISPVAGAVGIVSEELSSRKKKMEKNLQALGEEGKKTSTKLKMGFKEIAGAAGAVGLAATGAGLIGKELIGSTPDSKKKTTPLKTTKDDKLLPTPANVPTPVNQEKVGAAYSPQIGTTAAGSPRPTYAKQYNYNVKGDYYRQNVKIY